MECLVCGTTEDVIDNFCDEHFDIFYEDPIEPKIAVKLTREEQEELNREYIRLNASGGA